MKKLESIKNYLENYGIMIVFPFQQNERNKNYVANCLTRKGLTSTIYAPLELNTLKKGSY